MHVLTKSLLLLLCTMALVACNGGGGGSSAPAVTLDALSLSTNSISVNFGETQSVIATAQYSNGTSEDVSDQITWSSGNFASGSGGVISGQQVGTETLVATFEDQTASLVVTVNNVVTGLSLSMDAINVPLGGTNSLTATASFRDGSVQDVTSSLSWSGDSIASANQGVVSGASVGSTTLTASYEGAEDILNVTVTSAPVATLASISLSSSNITVGFQSSTSVVVNANYSDGAVLDVTDQVVWSTSGVASVNNQGSVSGDSVGTVSLTATFGSQSTNLSVTVEPVLQSLELDQSSLTVDLASTATVIATARYNDGSTQNVTSQISWSASSVASGSGGVISGNEVGSVTLVASFDGQQDSLDVSVEAALVSIALNVETLNIDLGSSATVVATALFNDGSSQNVSENLLWSTSVVASGNAAIISADSVGSATLTATYDGQTDSVSVTVTPVLSSLSLNVASLIVGLNSTEPVIATASFNDGSSSDVTSSIVWSSSAIASGSGGSISGLLVGSDTLTASYSIGNGSPTVSDSLVVNVEAVLQSLVVNPQDLTVITTRTGSVVLTGTYNDGSSVDVTDIVTWSSSDSGVATGDDNSGVLNGLSEGSAILTASLDNQTAAVNLSVLDLALSRIEISPFTLSLPNGLSQTLTAQGIYTDGSVEDISDQVTWSSNNSVVATASDLLASKGEVEALSLGQTTIQAELDSVIGASTINVVSASLTGLTMNLTSPTLAVGLSGTVEISANYSDGTTLDATTLDGLSVASSETAVANFSSGDSSTIEAIGLGSAILVANLEDKSANAAIVVTDAVLQSIDVSASQTQIASGYTLELAATANFSDGSSQDVSDQVTWVSDDELVATVSNTQGIEGVVTGVSQGSVTVGASIGAISGAISLDISEAVLVSLDVSSVTSIQEKESSQATALGEYSDGSTQDVSSQVSWASSNTDVLSISNESNSSGLFTAQTVGVASISAELNGVDSNTFEVSVTSDPNEPVAMILSSSVNSLLNDGQDSATLTATLIPRGNAGVIPDGTAVEFTISESAGDVVQSVFTVGGVATISITNSELLDVGSVRFLDVVATATDSGVENSTSLLLFSDFRQLLITEGEEQNVVYDSATRTISDGSTFIVSLRNYSDRAFTFTEVRTLQPTGVTADNPPQLTAAIIERLPDAGPLPSDGDISAGESFGFGTQLDSDLVLVEGDDFERLIIQVDLEDDLTGDEFVIQVDFDFSSR